MQGIDVPLRPVLSSEELKRLSERNDWRSLVGIIRVFVLLALVIAIALSLGGWWMIPAFVFVAGLQHALSILQHESVHGLLFRSHRLNDVIGTVLLSYPIGFSLAYRAVHFAHHRHLGEPEDPDLYNYRPFPASRGTVLRKIIRECSGWGAVTQFMGSGASTSGARPHLLGIALAQAVIFSLFVFVGHPLAYIGLWLLPLATLAKGFAQMRNVAEHLIRPDAPVGTERLRTFQSSLLERFFLAPLNFNYHAEHHWYTTVPYYRLPALRRLLQRRQGYQEHAEWCTSYVSILRRLVRQPTSL